MLPCTSHELQAGTRAVTMAQQTSEDLSSDFPLIKTWNTHCFSHMASKCLRCFECDGPNPASDLCSHCHFHGASGCAASFRTWMFTEKCSHLVVRWRCSPRPWKGGVHCCHLPSAPPLPFLSPLGLASFVGLRCQLKVVPVVQPI